ncbi:lamin tail domain-containing protein [Halosimplex salinum]|uniref:lamin tail domain-containing protein n=1 Tax=Halosimplex salinum TaxID=1710538 RepID=UPI0019D0BE50|nr:lamin tail domain-containing protein [Halosimplex salinum]
MPSDTTWTRLEPRTRDADLRDGLRAAVHDPLWLLGRQWQTGEFVGEDAGSLVDARLSLDVERMARGRPGGPDASVPDTVFSDGDAEPPLETLVERQRVRPDGADDTDRNVRLAAEAGAHFQRLLGPVVAAEATEYPESAHLSAETGDEGDESDDSDGSDEADEADDSGESDETPSETKRYLSVVGDRALDGDALYDAYDFADYAAFETAMRGDSPPPAPESFDPDAADDDTLRDYWDAVESYREWYESRYSEPEPGADGGSWDDDRQEYEYAVSTGSESDETVLTADEYEGGRLDWHAFDVDHEASLEPDDWTGPATERVERSLVPAPTAFEGMPAERWWEFEDDGVDLSAVEAAPEDLSRLLLLEFALVYGNDWFTIPVDLPVGSLSSVASFELETTFGETIDADDAIVTDEDATTGWNMYSMGLDATGDERGLFLAPTLVESVESETVESVELARDESANVAWAVETTLEGRVGQARDRDEEVAGGEDATPVATSEDAEVAYQLATDVPDNWFPLLPRRRSLGDVSLELGRLLTDDGPPAEPLGDVLAGDLSVPDEEVSRTGKTVDRRYALTRWTDGSTHLWGGRETSVGGGGTASGLAFDELVDPRTGDESAPVGDPTPFPDAEPVPPTARIELTDAQFETPGGARENLDAETVTLTNVGDDSLDVSGWSVADAAGTAYRVADGTTLGGGASLTLHTGSGPDTDTDRYWGRSQAVWNDAGDTVHVFDDGGALVLARTVPERPEDVTGDPLALAAVVADPTGTGADPTEEYVVFENASGGPLDVSGWRVEDAAGHSYRFPAGTELAADASIRLYSGVGADDTGECYWGRGSAVWNNSGDTVSVFDAAGALVLRHSY